MLKVIAKAADLTLDPRSLPKMPLPRQVMMVRPTFFNVDTPINPHMRAADGSLHHLDRNLAFAQWEGVRAAYAKLGVRVTVIDGQPGLPDMVFCANQCLPVLDTLGARLAVASNMYNDVRHREVPFIANALTRAGYHVQSLGPRVPGRTFESMGDCVWLPGRRFLLGGYGHRTAAGVYATVSELASASVATFELVNPRFYHLDTCLSILSSEAALACREAFTSEGWSLLEKIFPTLLPVPLEEADSPGFACNAHCPDEKHVIIEQGNKRSEALLRKAGFEPVPVATGEFIKSGGSVFCMKLMFW